MEKHRKAAFTVEAKTSDFSMRQNFVSNKMKFFFRKPKLKIGMWFNWTVSLEWIFWSKVNYVKKSTFLDIILMQINKEFQFYRKVM